jgi:hypothetical protein
MSKFWAVTRSLLNWPFRMWALANVRHAHDRRTCNHTGLVNVTGVSWEEGQCLDCIRELGRREGHAEAGAYYTHREAMRRVRRHIRRAAPGREGAG